MNQIIAILSSSDRLCEKLAQIEDAGFEYKALPGLQILVYGVGSFQLEFNGQGRLVAV